MRTMLLSSLAVALATITSNPVAAVPITHVVHEERDSLPRRWIRGDRVSSESILPMRIGLVQNNLDLAEGHLMDVSHPDSPNFGKHWTPEQVIETFQPSTETVDAVRDWLTSMGIAASRIVHTDNKGWLAFDATAAEAESLLHTEFYDYVHVENGAKLPACDQYHVPKHVQTHIDYITPGIRLLEPYPKASTQQSKRDASTFTPGKGRRVLMQENVGEEASPDDLSTCDKTITPACIRALYQIPAQTTKNLDAGNALGVFESNANYYYQGDLDLFFAKFSLQIPQGTHPTPNFIDGAEAPTTNQSNAGDESSLDLSLGYSIVYPQKITLYQTDDSVYELDPNMTYTFGFNTFLDALDGSYCTYSAYGETGDSSMDPQYPDPAPGGYKGPLQCGVYKPTNVISISYAGQEVDVPVPYQKRQCNEYLKLGLQGVSILFASGDSGVGNDPAPYGSDGPTGCIGPKYNIFNPTWPNNCPWVTTVGGTKVYPGKTVYQPESAVFDPAGARFVVNLSSGGGFSNVHAAPSYQKTAIDQYFRISNPPYPYYSGLINNTNQIGGPGFGAEGGIYNRIGRGIPDVAANGDNTAVYVGGRFFRAGGTSASTPIFASIINRLTEERLAVGKKPLGFLNPSLYANPWALNDITNGTNPGCGTNGFSTAIGWDPVTGLGTPNYPKMRTLFVDMLP